MTWLLGASVSPSREGDASTHLLASHERDMRQCLEQDRPGSSPPPPRPVPLPDHLPFLIPSGCGGQALGLPTGPGKGTVLPLCSATPETTPSPLCARGAKVQKEPKHEAPRGPSGWAQSPPTPAPSGVSIHAFISSLTHSTNSAECPLGVRRLVGSTDCERRPSLMAEVQQKDLPPASLGQLWGSRHWAVIEVE